VKEKNKLSVVSYEELVNGAVKLIPKTEELKKLWDGHVNAAMALKDNLNASKMAIAEIAERACVIYRGGPLKDDESGRKRKELSLKRFAKAIKIPYGTLGRWTVLKKRVFDHLPESHRRDFRIWSAELASREIGTKLTTKEEVLAVYESKLEYSETDAVRVRFLRDIGRVRAKISKIEVIQALSEKDREALRGMAKESLKTLNAIEQIERGAHGRKKRAMGATRTAHQSREVRA
jgi:hypothetical protein